MNTPKVGKWSLVILLVMTLSIVGTVSAQIVIPKIFEDVTILHHFAEYIGWLKENGIASGYPDGTYRPDQSITRGEMAKMLKNTASTVVAAGVSVRRNASDHPYIDAWFNNVNGVAPTVSGNDGYYDIDLGFPVKDKFFMCTVNTYHGDTRDAICTVNMFTGNRVYVRIFDISKGGLAPGEFWLLVYGNDIQP